MASYPTKMIFARRSVWGWTFERRAGAPRIPLGLTAEDVHRFRVGPRVIHQIEIEKIRALAADPGRSCS